MGELLAALQPLGPGGLLGGLCSGWPLYTSCAADEKGSVNAGGWLITDKKNKPKDQKNKKNTTKA
ncbi:hypothetical protein KZ853_08270, partial [Pseudomonas aeruginosa]|uniref:hypothetical protein n=1 Tax=Pseudomonas aeruginosa TaxID=287 RepID=UPI001CA54DCF